MVKSNVPETLRALSNVDWEADRTAGFYEEWDNVCGRPESLRSTQRFSTLGVGLASPKLISSDRGLQKSICSSRMGMA